MQLTIPCKKCIVLPSCKKHKINCPDITSYYQFIMLLRITSTIMFGGLIAFCTLFSFFEDVVIDIIVPSIVIVIASLMSSFSLYIEHRLDKMKFEDEIKEMKGGKYNNV